jgi:Transcriptional regulator
MTPQETQEERATAQERILLAAEQTFALKGYSGTRVSDIAEKAEVNVALINYYFESKEKLYHGVLDRLFSKWGEHVRELAWNDGDPEKVLTAYIYKHFEFKCNNMNMLRIFHWESLSDGGIYQEYIHRYWEKDALEKLDVLKQWKRRGLLNPNLNEHVILALIWGMMDRLLLSKMNHLEFFLGADEASVDTSEMLRATATAIMEMAIYGALKRTNEFGAPSLPPQPCRLLVATLDDGAAESEEFADLMNGLQSVPEVELLLLASSAEAMPGSLQPLDGLLLIVSSRYGELAEAARLRLETLESYAEKNGLSGLPAAVWVIRGDREALPLQGMLEQQLGRMGLYPLQRLIEQSPNSFGRRFSQYAKRMHSCLDKE